MALNLEKCELSHGHPEGFSHGGSGLRLDFSVYKTGFYKIHSYAVEESERAHVELQAPRLYLMRGQHSSVTL